MTNSEPSYTIERHEDQPIIILTGHHIRGNAGPVIEAMRVDMDRYLTDLDRPAFIIFDFATLYITFRQMVESMAATTRGEVAGSLRDPRIIQSVFVTTNPVLETSSKAFGQNQFGGLRIPVFPTLAEALEYVQQQLAD